MHIQNRKQEKWKYKAASIASVTTVTATQHMISALTDINSLNTYRTMLFQLYIRVKQVGK